MTTELPEELEKLLKPLYMSGSFDVFNLRIGVEKELAKARAELLLELLQVFNDYEVPLTMTAEQVRDILEEYLTKKD